MGRGARIRRVVDLTAPGPPRTTRPGIRRGVVTAAGLLGLAVVAGCGSTIESDEIDVGSITEAIPSAIAPQDPNVVTDVLCPGIVLRAGPAVSCSALLSGTEIPIVVRPVGGEGGVEISTTAPLLARADIEADLAARVEDDLGPGGASGSCSGPAVRVPAAGTLVDCEVVNRDGVILEFVVELLDDGGGYRAAPK